MLPSNDFGLKHLGCFLVMTSLVVHSLCFVDTTYLDKIKCEESAIFFSNLE